MKTVGLAFLVILAGILAINGWMMMLAIGIIHADILPAVRPAGFGTGLALGVVLSMLLGGASRASK